ncbi:flavin reductase [Sedimentibacter sp.]|uniref:flavin reductase n=1 Tax=Sedimentibacter sp. TaxID=1960295 RepID=UPI0028ACF9B9|nr:flavin reductase [Sedimentibacter sp.]
MRDYIEIKPEELNKSAFQMIGNDWMLITAEKDNKANTMTASWGGFGVMWNKNVSYIVLRPQRYTKEFIDNTDTFSLCFFDNKYKKELSYLGSVSGRDEDKMNKTALTLNHYDNIPYFEEADIIITCRKLFAQELNPDAFIEKNLIEKNYPDKDFHTMYISEVLKVMIRKQ